MNKQKKNRKGFTLVELMVVVVIIGILTAIAIPVYLSVTAKAEEKTCQANQRIIDSAVVMYKAQYNDFPTWDELIALTGDEKLLVETPVCPSSSPCTYSIDATTGLSVVSVGDNILAHALH